MMLRHVLALSESTQPAVLSMITGWNQGFKVSVETDVKVSSHLCASSTMTALQGTSASSS